MIEQGLHGGSKSSPGHRRPTIKEIIRSMVGLCVAYAGSLSGARRDIARSVCGSHL